MFEGILTTKKVRPPGDDCHQRAAVPPRTCLVLSNSAVRITQVPKRATLFFSFFDIHLKLSLRLAMISWASLRIGPTSELQRR